MSNAQNTAPMILDLPIGLADTGHRKEFDSLGDVMVPADRYLGAQPVGQPSLSLQALPDGMVCRSQSSSGCHQRVRVLVCPAGQRHRPVPGGRWSRISVARTAIWVRLVICNLASRWDTLFFTIFSATNIRPAICRLVRP